MANRKKTYTIEMEETKSGLKMTRTNNGFNTFELIGILKVTQDDLFKQISDHERGKIDEIKRVIVGEKKQQQ